MPSSTPLGFEYPLDADAPNGPAEMKQIAEKADAFTQLGGVAGHFVSTAALTRASTTYGSFSTPIKVELPKVAADQLIDIYLLTWCKLGEPHPFLRLAVGGEAIQRRLLFTEDAIEVIGAAGKFAVVASNAGYEGFSLIPLGPELTEAEAITRSGLLSTGRSGFPSPVSVKNKNAEGKPLAIELQGKIASGTVSLQGAYLAAHVRA